MYLMPASSVKKGRLGEERACQYLCQQGYSLVKRNLRCSAGEVDIIAYKDGILSFVEVKSWNRVTICDLEIAISVKKRKRIVQCAAVFLAQNTHWQTFQIRFDVLFLTKEETYYYLNAFTEDGFK